jgi:hypothetical protein
MSCFSLSPEHYKFDIKCLVAWCEIPCFIVSVNDNTSYAGTKANYNACFTGLIVQQSFLLLTSWFSLMNSSLPTKTVSFSHQTSCSGSFSHDALLLCVVQILRLCLLQRWLAPGMFRISVPAVQASSSWRLVPFRGKHQKRLGSISDGSGFV